MAEDTIASKNMYQAHWDKLAESDDTADLLRHIAYELFCLRNDNVGLQLDHIDRALGTLDDTTDRVATALERIADALEEKNAKPEG